MRIRVARILLVAMLVTCAVTGSKCTSESYSCWHDDCTVNLHGAPQEVDAGGSFYLYVDAIDATGVTVAAGTDRARLAVGQSTVVGDLMVNLVSLDGEDATLRVTPAA